ncbi:MAG: class I SAM-dependent methyltransferase [bacterium]
MSDQEPIAPESSAARVALWRAMHVQVDPAPHILEDEVGLRLISPDENWRQRPDMDPQATKLFRASIVARSRFIEDLVSEQAQRNVHQYVILGAGLDTFAQRKPEIASQLRIFEIDKPGPQAWKQRRLIELGYGIPDYLRWVPVNFESNEPWWEKLAAAGFDANQPSVVVSTGVTMYLTRTAIQATLQAIAKFHGATLAMTYLLPTELADPEERPAREMAEKGAKKSGTPFINFYAPEEMQTLALEAGFKKAQTVPASTLSQRYFAERTDGLRLSKSEEFLISTT